MQGGSGGGNGEKSPAIGSGKIPRRGVRIVTHARLVASRNGVSRSAGLPCTLFFGGGLASASAQTQSVYRRAAKARRNREPNIRSGCRTFWTSRSGSGTDLGGSFTVDAEGNVTLPLIGAVRAVGAFDGRELSTSSLAASRSWIAEISQVTVAVAQYNSRRVFVMGEVQRRERFRFPKMPGIWEVIREAGGPTAEASLGRVRVIPPEGQGARRGDRSRQRDFHG